MKHTAAVVVTYNRKELLKDCIRKLLLQTWNDLDILIVDNASSDGTKEALQEFIKAKQIRYFNTGSNLGGAGGFQFGMRKAVEEGYEYVWVMDDDAMPEEDALEVLHRAGKCVSGWGFLSSKVLWKDGTLCRMNIQRDLSLKNIKEEQLLTAPAMRDGVYAEESDFEESERADENDSEAGERAGGNAGSSEAPGNGLIPCGAATFVSVLIPAEVIRKVGLPIREFFIWADDLEYTRRISRKYPCYVVPGSVIVHQCATNNGANISTDEEARISRYAYAYRNEVYLYRREGIKGLARIFLRTPLHIFRVLKNSKTKKAERIRTILDSTAKGFAFYPDIEYPAGDAVKRVLEVNVDDVGLGGVYALVRNVILENPDPDLTIDVAGIVPFEKEEHVKELNRCGSHVYYIGTKKSKLLRPAVYFRKLYALIRMKHYDAVHIHGDVAYLLLIFAAAAKKAGVKKIILHSHAAGVDGASRDVKLFLHRLARRPLMKLGTKRAACSDVAAAWMYPGHKPYVMINNGIDLEKFRFDPAVRKRVREELGFPENTTDPVFLIGHVGRFAYQKNHTFLLDVFAEVYRRDPSVRLLLIGEGVLEEEMKAKAAALGIADAVIFYGSSSRVNELMQAMDLFVLPSHFEGLPVVGVEAQAAGLPVLFSDAVTKEAALTDRAVYLPIGDGTIGMWASAILARRQNRRGEDSTGAEKKGSAAGSGAEKTGSAAGSEAEIRMKAADELNRTGFSIRSTVKAFLSLYR